MGFLFSSSKKEEKVAIFDIGSGSVGGAIVRIPIKGDRLPVITKSVRTELKPNKNFNLFQKGMISAIERTAKSLYNEKVGALDEIVCVLASPWYFSETRFIKMRKEKPFTFTKSIPSELINKEISNLTKSYEEKYKDSGVPEIIERHVVGVSLNGYLVSDPIGKKCKSLEMDMIVSLSPKSCLDDIREILSRVFHHVKVSFSSFPVDTFLAVRDKYVHADSYFLIDISGEVTDVGIVTEGVLRSVLSFPFGKKTFFNYISTKLNIEHRDAEELFKLYSHNSLSEELKNKVIPLLKSIENSWGESFNQSINTLPHTLTFPSTVFLTCDEDIRQWFSAVISSGKHIKSVIPEKCKVLTLEGPEFLNMCDVKEGECDPFLMIESIALKRKKER